MKSSEIKPGGEYAYVAWKRSTPRRVTVVAVGVTPPREQQRKFGVSATSTVQVLIEPECAEDTPFETFVRPSQIVHTWAKQVEYDAYHAEQARKRHEAADVTKRNRVAVAVALHEALTKAGVPAEPEHVFWDEDAAAALRAAGIPKSTDPDWDGDESVFDTPVKGLAEVIEKGHVRADLVAAVLGVNQQEVQW